MEIPIFGQRERHQLQAESVFEFLNLLITQSFQVQYLFASNLFCLIQEETEKTLLDAYF